MIPASSWKEEGVTNLFLGIFYSWILPEEHRGISFSSNSDSKVEKQGVGSSGLESWKAGRPEGLGRG